MPGARRMQRISSEHNKDPRPARPKLAAAPSSVVRAGGPLDRLPELQVVFHCFGWGPWYSRTISGGTTMTTRVHRISALAPLAVALMGFGGGLSVRAQETRPAVSPEPIGNGYTRVHRVD